MKIVAIETLCAREFENVLWARVHTDAGVFGLGETFYGAGAVAAHIHDTLAARLLGRDPLRIEAIHKELVNLPMAQSSTGAEYRAASAIDIALWDLWGRRRTSRCISCSAGSAATSCASTTPAPAINTSAIATSDPSIRGTSARTVPTRT